VDTAVAWRRENAPQHGIEIPLTRGRTVIRAKGIVTTPAPRRGFYLLFEKTTFTARGSTHCSFRWEKSDPGVSGRRCFPDSDNGSHSSRISMRDFSGPLAGRPRSGAKGKNGYKAVCSVEDKGCASSSQAHSGVTGSIDSVWSLHKESTSFTSTFYGLRGAPSRSAGRNRKLNRHSSFEAATGSGSGKG